MNKKHKQRLITLLAAILLLSIAAAFALFALQQNLSFYFTPSEIEFNKLSNNKTIRVGGIVVAGSFKRIKDLEVNFYITDLEQNLEVHFIGVLPDLFREGQGIVAVGKMREKYFNATQILAKHDENYRPPNIPNGYISDS